MVLVPLIRKNFRTRSPPVGYDYGSASDIAAVVSVALSAFEHRVDVVEGPMHIVAHATSEHKDIPAVL